MRYLQQTGRSLKLSAKELQVFIGATILMPCLRYPRVRMYWGKTTRVISITEIMTRDRFFTIRSNLKVTDDNAVTEETRRKDKLWKIRPLLECVKRACLSLPRTPEVAVDEQMIPFTGACAIKKFVRGKPNPEGLKNFVLAAPSGLVLDFEIYHGKGTFPEAIGQQLKQGIGALAVLRLCQSLPEGTQVFFDRYFTSVPLLESLAEKNLPATGTVMKSRIPRAVHLTADKILANQGCGSVDQTVRKDKHISIVKWYVQKPVITTSTKVGKNPMDQCKRWSKKDRRYIQVPCPAVISCYNKNTGGVDLTDRMMSFYRICTRTRKWTVKTIFHFIDLGIANSWIQYRCDRIKNDEPKKNMLQYLDFKIRIAEQLLRGQEEQHSDEDDEESTPKRRRLLPPQSPSPSVTLLPGMTGLKNSTRCKNSGCTKKTKIKCKGCSVFLRLSSQKNCFSEYHQK
ncbi:piggyBac transposable element-derived protein 3-like isoform X1 [Schistocerca piceifrons]|uniref:piggyBac transposable element-derived protein 3-like isoform X1 n=1 Tax=Schistocerca piceifrons TaxID=274613 RepID=UPI001F5F7C50|nr:piggyBac transposable element-derived protein 3-like isoform X1 [Schistocerca piceifrons]XP_047108127.1 piggyBac transposable element-derived protein 3-like isoform X1 [Schistocerca piceifrons]